MRSAWLATTQSGILLSVNMSSDQDSEYFSDGLSEELLNQLAQIPQLHVIARTSSFSFKGKEVDVATIAKALNVANVLEGSVRKSGNTLRIAAADPHLRQLAPVVANLRPRPNRCVQGPGRDFPRGGFGAETGAVPASRRTAPSARCSAAYEQYLIAGRIPGRREGCARGNRTIGASTCHRDRPRLRNAYALQSMALARAADFAEDAAARKHLISAALAAATRRSAPAPDLAIGYVRRGSIRLAVRWDRREDRFRACHGTRTR